MFLSEPHREPSVRSRSLCIGTAGHIDHGKSTLVKALTGTDPDRLKEEKERGITIDLGFAFLTLPSGDRLMFIDVPGHERFVRNMLAGAGGIDAAVLVIAADESVMPQTQEHLDILTLLAITSGVVVLTKCGLADAETRAVSRLEAEALVKGTFLQGAPILEVDAITGEGLPVLREALTALVQAARPREESRVFRLPVDRVFAIKGFGTVVTGTTQGRPLPVGSTVEILPSRRTSRLRAIEVAGEATAFARSGERTALNLPDVEVADVTRGDVVVPAGTLAPTRAIHARVTVLPRAAPLKARERVHLHLFSAEVLARVRFVEKGRHEIGPGGSALATLLLESPVVALSWDRFVLRRYSPMITIAGGRVILCDLEGARASRAGSDLLASLETQDAADAAGALVRHAGIEGLMPAELLPLIGSIPQRVGGEDIETTDTGRLVLASAISEASKTILKAVLEHHARAPLEPGAKTESLRAALFPRVAADVFRAAVRRAEAAAQLISEGDVLKSPVFVVTTTEDEAADLARMESAFREASGNPPSPAEVQKALGLAPARSERLLGLLMRQGKLRRIGGMLVFHAQVLDSIAAKVSALGATKPTLTVPEFKELVGCSRKYAIPLLEYLDSRLVTERKGDLRRILVKPAASKA